MSGSYLFHFKNDKHRKDFELDVWRINNFIKTQTRMMQFNHEFGLTCRLLRKILKEEMCV